MAWSRSSSLSGRPLPSPACSYRRSSSLERALMCSKRSVSATVSLLPCSLTMEDRWIGPPSMPSLDTSSVQVALPVSGHAPGRSGHRLVDRVVLRRSQDGTVGVLLRGVVPEPVLVRLVAADHGMPGVGRVVARVLRGRRITAANVTALGTTTQMEPPAAGCLALDAARSLSLIH